MSAPGFTKGPWSIADSSYDRSPGDEGPRWDVHIPHAQTIANVREEADAHLIASAPDLYEALDEIISYSGGADSALDDEYVMERAHAALAKARGEPA